MRGRQLILVVVLLLFHFFIRAHQILELDPYIDEGFHISRASMVYDFEQNPGRFAHGKLLLYFWLGIFETDRHHVLFTSRMGMALFSLIAASALYLIGRLLKGHWAGVLVMLLYATMPYISFFDRMALADPLASAFASLVVWRSLIFAKRPTIREGVIVGVLLGLASLAKLTMGLLPLMPVLAALIYYHWQSPKDSLKWAFAYIPPLIVAAVMVLLLWSPFVIPAYFARKSDDPFVIVHEQNVSDLGEKTLSERMDYMWDVLKMLRDFTSEEFLWLIPGVLLLWLIVGRPVHKELRDTLFLIGWFLLVWLLSAATATISTTRYFSPITPPILMLIAYVAIAFWQRGIFYKVFSAAILGGLAAWLVYFAYPFTTTMWRDYRDLDFHSTNSSEYHVGYLNADKAVQDAARSLNEMEPQPEHVYAAWWICPTLYFYTDMEVTCFDQKPTHADVGAELRRVLSDGESAYLVFSGYRPFFRNIDGLEDEVFRQFSRPNIRWDDDRDNVWDVWIYRVWWNDTD